jgi:hypothetical protein
LNLPLFEMTFAHRSMRATMNPFDKACSLIGLNGRIFSVKLAGPNRGSQPLIVGE